MRQIISPNPLTKSTKPCQILHYDLIILNPGFEGSKAFAYFSCPLLKMEWGFPLANKGQAEQIRLIRFMVNMIERAYGFTVEIIPSDQETGIGFSSQDWVKVLWKKFALVKIDSTGRRGSLIYHCESPIAFRRIPLCLIKGAS